MNCEVKTFLDISPLQLADLCECFLVGFQMKDPMPHLIILKMLGCQLQESGRVSVQYASVSVSVQVSAPSSLFTRPITALSPLFLSPRARPDLLFRHGM